MVKLSTIKQVGFPQTTWEPILTYMWLEQFRQQVLPHIRTSQSVSLCRVINQLTNPSYNGKSLYHVDMIDYLLCPDFDWPPPPLISWRDSRQAWNELEKSVGTYTVKNQRRTHPLEPKDYMPSACYKL